MSDFDFMLNIIWIDWCNSKETMTHELAHVYTCLVTTFAVALLPKSMSNNQSWSRDYFGTRVLLWCGFLTFW